MVKPEDAPRLEEWMTATEAAAAFGVSRTTVNEMITAGEFETLHVFGPASRPQYIVRRAEVENLQSVRTFPRARTQNR